MMSPAIIASIFKSMGLDMDQMRAAWEGLVGRVNGFENLLTTQTKAIMALNESVGEMNNRLEAMRLKLDADAVGETPISVVIAENLNLEAKHGEGQDQ
jgi:hypothetical protein